MANQIRLAMLTTFCVILVLTSCKRELEQPPTHSRNIGFVQNPPTVDATGLLVFNDESALNEWLDYLSMQTSSEFMIFHQKSDDKILDGIEDDFTGFFSMRRYYQNIQDEVDEQGFTSFDDYPEFPYLKDPILRSVLNSDRGVIIGNNIYYYVNDRIKLVIENLDYNIYQAIVADPPECDDSNFGQQYYFDYATSVGALLETSNGLSAKVTSTTSNYELQTDFSHSSCSSTNWTFSLDINNNAAPSSTSVNWTAVINWGDGSANSTITGTVNGANNSASHAYTASGTYNVTVTVSYSNPLISDDELTFAPSVVTGGSCHYEAYSSPSHWVSFIEDGITYAIRGEIWKTLSSSFRVGARTRSYKWQGGSFKSFSAYRLGVTITGDHFRRNFSCGEDHPLIESDLCSTCGSIAARKAPAHNYIEDDGLHALYKMRVKSSASYHYFELFMDFCPTPTAHR